MRGAASVDDRWTLLGDESYAVSGSLGSALGGDRGIPALNLSFKRDQDARCVSEALFTGFDALANGRSELPRHRRGLISGMSEHAVPEGYQSITPYLAINGLGELIEFVQAAFDAELKECIPGPDGRPAHAEVQIGDSMVMMGEAAEDGPVFPAMLYLYVTDVDAQLERAIASGAELVRAVEDQPYGDRVGAVSDPAGNQWWIATRKETLTSEEIAERMSESGGE